MVVVAFVACFLAGAVSLTGAGLASSSAGVGSADGWGSGVGMFTGAALKVLGCIVGIGVGLRVET